MTQSDMRFHDPEHKFEKNFWGDCTNTYGEEMKHYVYARLMGLEMRYNSFDARGQRVLDIGGGPVSMLLKTFNLAGGMVIDPIRYPDWVYRRYHIKGLLSHILPGEEVSVSTCGRWDEVWIYNVLQHCVDPCKIIANARQVGRVIRVFEWIDFPPHEGHPHMLTANDLSQWLGRPGSIFQLNVSGCVGNSFSGTFMGRG